MISLTTTTETSPSPSLSSSIVHNKLANTNNASSTLTINGNTVTKKIKTGGKQSRIYFWSKECKYSVILDLIKEFGEEWKLIDDEKLLNRINLFWIDISSIHEHFHHIQPWQMINHFPGMSNIARKNRMGQNLNYMQKLFPKEYSFYPRTWVLPGEMSDFRSQFDHHGMSLNNKIFIIKPDTGCQGKGIFLTRTLETVPFNENVVAQVYIKKPLLLDGFKFDLRLYCIVTSVKPLRMYLFHDGLVRMCTEEYVKPTKDNIGMACMHLTNYAVNKHNGNFTQPAAQSSEDYQTQDDASKRSLLWFMNWIKSQHGESKAAWLWKRMGVLCTRTVISILPTLSREYDQHFKSFNNIPVDLTKIPTTSSTGASGMTTAPSGLPAKPPIAGKASALSGRMRTSSKDRAGSGSDRDNDAENEDSDNTEMEDKRNSEETGNNKEKESTGPKIRGSRCFEILGFDIMIDSNLNPWLIEVNHLPSFGTDSPLDKDIKDRLMRQVFSVLPVSADDQLAYAAYHKAESEKRLNAHNNSVKEEEELKLKALTEKSRVGTPKSERKKDNSVGSPSKLTKTNNKPHEENLIDVEAVSSVVFQEQSDIGIGFTDPSFRHVTEDDNTSHLNDSNSLDDMMEVIEEKCTPERIEEIKHILFDIYDKKSPEKVAMIDVLLEKYAGNEESFLLFVFTKYGMSPSDYEYSKPKAVRDAITGRAAKEALKSSAANMTQSSQILPDNIDRPNTITTDTANQKNGVSSGNKNNKNDPKRYARSCSPPRNSAGPRRIVAVWKSSISDEDASLKSEIFASHIPTENDEWMKLEAKLLTQCTRIFPPENLGEEEGEEALSKEEEENEDDTEGQQKQSIPKEAATVKPNKLASYEDIIFKVFLEDRRAAYRKTRPLPNRAKGEEGGFLPPLDPPVSSRSSISSMGSGKGVVGWKAPPKPATKNESIKLPTASQADAAKRLSQGLSVFTSNKQRTVSLPFNGMIESKYSLVLDPQEYGSNSSSIAMAGGNEEYIPTMSGAYTNGNDMLWPSTKAHRLYEESRSNKMKIEAARVHNPAFLRQQMFLFDPSQQQDTLSSFTHSVLSDGNGSFVRGGMGTESNAVYKQPQFLQSQRFGINSNAAGMHSNIHNSSYFVPRDPQFTIMIQQQEQQQILQQALQQQQLRPRLSGQATSPAHFHSTQPVYTALSGTPVVPVQNGLSLGITSKMITPTQMRAPSKAVVTSSNNNVFKVANN